MHRSSAAYYDEYYDDEPGLFDGMDPEEAYVACKCLCTIQVVPESFG